MKAKHLILALGLLFAGQAMAAGPVVGGFAPMDPGSAEAVEAARFAVMAKNALPDSKPVRLTAIRRAAQQVVAGMNYRLCLSVKDRTHRFRVRTVVYVDLKGEKILTEWTPNGC